MIDNVKPSVRPDTYARYAEIIRLHLKPALGTILLANLSPADVQRMLSKLEHKGHRGGHRGGKLTPGTYSHAMPNLQREATDRLGALLASG